MVFLFPVSLRLATGSLLPIALALHWWTIVEFYEIIWLFLLDGFLNLSKGSLLKFKEDLAEPWFDLLLLFLRLLIYTDFLFKSRWAFTSYLIFIALNSPCYAASSIASLRDCPWFFFFDPWDFLEGDWFSVLSDIFDFDFLFFEWDWFSVLSDIFDFDFLFFDFIRKFSVVFMSFEVSVERHFLITFFGFCFFKNCSSNS